MKKQKQSQKIVTAFIIGIIACTVIAMGSLLVMFALPIQGDYVTESQATAQYLEQYQAIPPAFIRVNHECRDNAPHCFWIVPEIIADPANSIAEMLRQADTLVIMIDGQVTQALTPILFGDDLYVDLELSQFGAGLHLIEVQISDDDGRIYRYSWAERSATGVIQAPATLAVPPTYATAIPDDD